MEYDWERTFPFLELDNTKIIKLFEGILESQDIINVMPISEGCRTTNYVIETKEYRKKYILKIFFSKEQNYKREIKLLSKLKGNKNILVPKLYKMSSDEVGDEKEVGEDGVGEEVEKIISHPKIVDIRERAFAFAVRIVCCVSF